MADVFSLPADLIEKHMTPAPAAEAAAPEPKAEENADKAPKTADKDKAKAEAGEQEPEDDAPEKAAPPVEEEEQEPDEEEEPEEPEEEEEPDDEPPAGETSEEEADEDDVLETVSAAELQRIEKDPALKKVYRSMQRAFMQKTTAVAEARKEVEAQRTGIEALRTPDGMSTYIAQLMGDYPDVVGAAFDAALMSKHGDPAAFLLEIGLAAPKVFEGVYNKLADLLQDETALARHRRGQEQQRKASDLNAKEREIVEREKAVLGEAFDRDFLALGNQLEKLAATAGIQPGEDLLELKEALLAELKTDSRGRIATTAADLKKLVGRVSAAQRVREERIRARVERELGVKRSEQSVERTREMARDAGKPVRSAPRGVKRAPPVEHAPYVPKPGEDPLAGYLKQKLGVGA